MSIKKSVYCSTFLSAIMLLQACNTMETTIAGHYIYGHEVNSFQPCDKEVLFGSGVRMNNLN
jgi:hypothetical protein